MNNIPDFTLTLDQNEKDIYKLSRIFIRHIYYIRSWFKEVLNVEINYLAINKDLYFIVKIYNFVHIYDNFDINKADDDELIGFLMNFHVIYNSSLENEFIIGKIESDNEDDDISNKIRLKIKIKH